LKNGEDCVTDVVVEAGFEFLGKTAGEKVVTITVTGFGAKWALRVQWGVKEREAEFAADEEAILIGGDLVVMEALG
jgi:hypothetical protein